MFYCKKCSTTTWVYERWDSEEMERPVCRSEKVSVQIGEHEEKLKDAIDANDYFKLDENLKSCAGVDIAVKMMKKA